MNSKYYKILAFLSAVATAVLLALSFYRMSPSRILDQQALKVEKRLAEREKLLAGYVEQALLTPKEEWLEIEDFPSDMVIYRYCNDSIQSWINDFSISNDRVFAYPLLHRLYYMSNSDASHTPLAYVEGLESYVNLGSAWYEVKTYVDGEIKLVTGILIKNEYPEDNIPATGKINPLLRLKKGFTTVALHMDSRAVVHSSNGVPLFSVIPSSDTTFIYGDYAYRWAAMATLILFIICFHASIRTRRSFWIAMAVLTASWIYARVLPWKCNPEIGFFSPLVYADSKLFNSLASLIFTNSFIAISVLAAYMVRRRLLKAYLQLSRKWQKLVGCVALLYTLTLALYIG